MRVDLPAALGPTTAVILPGARTRSTPSRTRLWPKRLLSPTISIIGASACAVMGHEWPPASVSETRVRRHRAPIEWDCATGPEPVHWPKRPWRTGERGDRER